jgi:hypothetical protein
MRHFLPSKRLTLLASTLTATVCLLVLLPASGPNSLGQNTAITYPHVVASVHLTNLTDPITTTTLFTPKQGGLYRISAYMTVPLPASSGDQWRFVLGWTDDAGVQSWTTTGVNALSVPPQSSSTALLGTPGTTSGLTIFRPSANTPVTYQVCRYDNSPCEQGPDGSTYELFFVAEQLQ